LYILIFKKFAGWSLYQLHMPILNVTSGYDNSFFLQKEKP